MYAELILTYCGVRSVVRIDAEAAPSLRLSLTENSRWRIAAAAASKAPPSRLPPDATLMPATASSSRLGSMAAPLAPAAITILPTLGSPP